jgi:hypothetical protein
MKMWKLLMENWRQHMEEGLVPLNPPSSSEPSAEEYGEYTKDRPRQRRTLSIRAEDVESGLYFLQRNLDNLTADIEEDPNFDPQPRQQQIFTMAQRLEDGLMSVSSKKSGLSDEDKARLDKKIKDFKKRVEELGIAPYYAPSALGGAKTLESKEASLKEMKELTRKYVQLMETIREWQDQK